MKFKEPENVCFGGGAGVKGNLSLCLVFRNPTPLCLGLRLDMVPKIGDPNIVP